MKLNSTLLFLASTLLVLGCSDKSDPPSEDSSTSEETRTFEVEAIEFEVDTDRLLSSLTDQEIRGECERMARVTRETDKRVACRVVAAGAESSVEKCEQSEATCLEESELTMDATTIRTAPAPINCKIFGAALTEGCEHKLSELEACANALVESVVPAAEAVSCDKAGQFSDIEEANSLAKKEQSTAFVGICAGLVECEALVGALLTGKGPSGLGGAGGKQ